MNHIFLTDAELTALQSFVCENRTDIESHIALTRRDPLGPYERDDLHAAKRLMTGVAKQLADPLGRLVTTDTLLRDLDVRDLRRRQKAIRKTNNDLAKLSSAVFCEMNQRWRRTIKGGECAICEDTSGRCAHRDMEYLAFVDEIDNPEREGVTA